MRRKCRQMCDVSFDRAQVSLFGHPAFICPVVCNILFCFGCEEDSLLYESLNVCSVFLGLEFVFLWTQTLCQFRSCQSPSLDGKLTGSSVASNMDMEISSTGCFNVTDRKRTIWTLVTIMRVKDRSKSLSGCGDF